jgi:hypothetical protein
MLLFPEMSKPGDLPIMAIFLLITMKFKKER